MTNYPITTPSKYPAGVRRQTTRCFIYASLILISEATIDAQGWLDPAADITAKIYQKTPNSFFDTI